MPWYNPMPFVELLSQTLIENRVHNNYVHLSFKLPMQYYIIANDYNWVCSSRASCASKVQDLVQGVHNHKSTNDTKY